MAIREEWLMLAFPGQDTGHYALRAFAPAKSGKCWFRKLRSREQAIACKRELVKAGIRYSCKKIETGPSDKPRRIAGQHVANGQRAPRGYTEYINA